MDDRFGEIVIVPKDAQGSGAEKQAASMRRSREVRNSREREGAQEIAMKLTAATVQVSARAGEGGKLFGSVTATDIATACDYEAKCRRPCAISNE